MTEQSQNRCLRFHELTAPEIRELAPAAVTVLPLGATEQHGRHLATGTDTFINQGLQDRLFANAPAGTFLFLPTLPFGASEHHLDYGGTLSLRPSRYVRLLVDLLANLTEAGHRKIVLLNSHGGNHAPMQAALAECARSVAAAGSFVVGLTYWESAESLWRAEIPDLETTRMGHACELETSMMLTLRPDITDKPAPEESPFPSVNEQFKSSALPFPHLTREGHMGNPRAASPEKGEALLDQAARGLRRYLADFYHSDLPEKQFPR